MTYRKRSRAIFQISKRGLMVAAGNKQKKLGVFVKLNRELR